MQQVVHVADARHLAHLALDALDILGVVELAAQDDNPAVGVDADAPLGNRAVAEQLALHLVHQADVVQFSRLVLGVPDPVRDARDLAGFVARLALEAAYPPAQGGLHTVAQGMSPLGAAARIKEEPECYSRRQRGSCDRRQLAKTLPR